MKTLTITAMVLGVLFTVSASQPAEARFYYGGPVYYDYYGGPGPGYYDYGYRNQGLIPNILDRLF